MLVLAPSIDAAEQFVFGMFPDMLPPIRIITRESDLLFREVRASSVLSLRVKGWNPALEDAARRRGGFVWVVFPPSVPMPAPR